MLKRQRQSSKLTSEQIQRKLTENGLLKDDLSKNAPVNIYRFEWVINRKSYF